MTQNRTIRDGLVVGLIAYAAVALFYTAFDILAARGALYTVDLLGRAMFKGLRDPSILMFSLDRDPTAILLYNAFHLVMSLGIGLLVTSLIEHAERHPSQAPLVLVMILAGGVLTVFAVAYLTEPMRPVLPWWSIVVANVLAALLAGFYLLRRRPGLWQRVGPPRLLIGEGVTARDLTTEGALVLADPGGVPRRAAAHSDARQRCRPRHG